MQIGPKYKIARRLGAPIFEKTQTRKFTISLERKTKHKREKPRTDYGKQLVEKQKARFFYGITEKQLKNYVKAALAKKGNSPILELAEALELRLDNAVWRLCLAPTHRSSRQLVAHGHICVNGRRTYSPSQHLSVGDEISVREGSQEKTAFKLLKENPSEKEIPAWLSLDKGKMAAKVKSRPGLADKELLFNLGEVLEFYQR